jgi:hypothetical protein
MTGDTCLRERREFVGDRGVVVLLFSSSPATGVDSAGSSNTSPAALATPSSSSSNTRDSKLRICASWRSIFVCIT